MKNNIHTSATPERHPRIEYVYNVNKCRTTQQCITYINEYNNNEINITYYINQKTTQHEK